MGKASITRVTFVHEETVRFRDLDSLGHMNNAVYATFLEQARIAFLAPLGAHVTGMILARLEIDFRAQVSFGDTVEIEVVTGRIGTKSFELAYTMRVGETGRIVNCDRPEPLAEVTADLLSRPPLLERMGEAGRRWVVERFDWDALAGQARQLFEDGMPR